MGCSKSSPKRDVYVNISLPQAMRKIHKQPNLTPRATRKRRRRTTTTTTTKNKVSRRKKIIKLREEINEK